MKNYFGRKDILADVCAQFVTERGIHGSKQDLCLRCENVGRKSHDE